MSLRSLLGAALVVLGLGSFGAQVVALAMWHHSAPHPISAREAIAALIYLPPDLGCAGAGAWIMSTGTDLGALAARSWRGLLRLRAHY